MSRSKLSGDAFLEGAFLKVTRPLPVGDQAHGVLKVQVATTAVMDLVGANVFEASSMQTAK
jgi:hypothetical protein